MGQDQGVPEVTRIRIGVALTTEPATVRERLETLCAALAPSLGIEVEPVGLWHYSRLLESLSLGDVDVAWLPPLLALKAMGRGRVLPIALPVRGGESSYFTVLFSRADTRIRSPKDLVAMRAAWVDRQSAAGYQIIRAALRAEGVNLETAFMAEQFLGVHDAVARAVMDGEADVGATFAYIDPTTGIVRRAGWGDAKVQIVAKAGPIPSDVVAASVRLPAKLIRNVQKCLVSPPNEAIAKSSRTLFSADSFVPPVAEHFEPLAQMLEAFETARDAGRPPYEG